MGNYNAKSEVEPEIFAISQHKVEWLPHLTHLTRIRHISFQHSVQFWEIHMVILATTHLQWMENFPLILLLP